jgi:hypothetical protein
MKKQTAVEWLIEQIGWYNIELSSELRFEIDKAKTMEKEQIVHCYEQAYRDGYIDNGKSGQDYYNETYGGDK